MTKTLLTWLLALSFIFVSCTKNEDPQPTPEPEAQPETPYIPLKTYYPAKINITTEGNATILHDTYISNYSNRLLQRGWNNSKKTYIPEQPKYEGEDIVHGNILKNHID